MVNALSNAYNGRRVLVTGHTGFKGSWLCEWLLGMGAEVVGYALEPQPHEVLYSQLGISGRLVADHRGDLRDLDRLTALVSEFQPEIVFHLAAQSFPKTSFDAPLDTMDTNIQGTNRILESLRKYFDISSCLSAPY